MISRSVKLLKLKPNSALAIVALVKLLGLYDSALLFPALPFRFGVRETLQGVENCACSANVAVGQPKYK